MRMVMLLVVVLLTIGGQAFTAGDDTKDKPPVSLIQVQGEDAARIRDAYNQMVLTRQGYEYAVLSAKYNNNVPKDWNWDLQIFAFTAPPKPPETKPKP